MFERSKVKGFSRELEKLYKQKHDLSRQYDDAESNGREAEQINARLKELSDRIAAFIENEYAMAVFEKYSKSKPQLIRIKTGETVSWDEAFGDDFERISKSLRHSLVGLVEEPGRYRLK